MERPFFEGPPPLVVGHRGNPARHADNSLAGVISGLGAVGAVEVDVRLTRDGHLLLWHEPEVGGRPIATSDSFDLLSMEPRPCLLDEVLPLGGRVNFEIKNLPGDEGFDPDGRVALLTASRGRSADLLTSFYWPDMDRLREREVPSPTGLLVGEGGSIEDTITHAVRQGHQAVSAHESLLTASTCDEAARLEVAVLAWTVNSVDRARELSGMGVTAIISDDPLLIRNGLRE